MKKYKSNKFIKRLVSLLLVLTVIAGLFVTFDVSVFAEEEPAKPGEIHAIIYVINPLKKTNDGAIDYTDNLELVFQKGGAEDPSRTVLAHFEDFCGADMENKQPPWRDEGDWNKLSSGKKTGPSNITIVDFKDKIQPVSMCMWFESFRTLTTENFKHVENVDTSKCISMKQTFNYDYALTSLDLSTWDVSNVKSMSCTFGRCWKLRDFNISTWTFENVTSMGMTFCGCEFDVLDLSSANFSKCTSMDRVFSIDGTYPTHKIKKIILPDNCQVANGCDLNRMFYKQSDLAEVNIESLQAYNPKRMQEMFVECKLLEDIDLSGITGSAEQGGGSSDNKNNAFTSMFKDCSLLKNIDYSRYTGPIKYSSSNSPFSGCENLASIDFANINTASGSVTDLTGKDNMFADCPELSWIRLSESWPANNKIGNTMAIKGSWKKLDDPGKGTEKSNDELFRNFQSNYKGTWGAMSVITFKGNGGSPQFQTVDGIKNDTITFDESTLIAERNGYDFAGWWPDKTAEPDGTSALKSGDEATKWNYYAHWDEHHYTLKLNGNGGTTAAVETETAGKYKTSDGKEVTATTGEGENTRASEFIATDNLSYEEFYELSNTLFTKEGSVLSSWNTRPNGTGKEYAANDSVDKLTEADGGSVTLFAQWHTPSVIISFNSHGGTLVDDKYYTIATGETVTYGELSESSRSADAQSRGGYTFLGWFTEEEGGTKITSTTQVTSSRTLHAHWQANPTVIFDANGGYFDNNPNKLTAEKTCRVDRALGVTPEPEHASASFDGWWTASTDGTEIDSSTKITEDVIYYAHWGFKPKFVTNGGTFVTYNADKYTSQVDNNYTITELPTVTKDNSEFLYWQFGTRNLSEELEYSTNSPKSISLDLLNGNLIEAVWKNKNKYTITLNKNDGTATKTDIRVYDNQPVGAFPEVKRSGYDFEGWFPNSDGTGTQLKETDTVSSSGDYYAKWTERDCTLTFNPDGGTMFDDDVLYVAAGKTVSSLPGANRASYHLEGWYTEKNGGGTRLETDTIINGNATYYANWEPEELSQDIYKYSIIWSQKSNSTVTNVGDNLSLHPIMGDEISANLFIKFSIDSKVNADKLLAPGTVKITIPKSLFTEDGEVKDTNNIGSFNSQLFTYSEDGDNYVFTNSVYLGAGASTDFTYTCKVMPRDIKGGYTDENGYYQGDYYSYTFTPSIVVEDNVNPLNYSKNLSIEAHTEVKTEAKKSRTSVVLEWNSNWGPKPADADEYFYVIWELESAGSSTSSQKYRYSWSEATAHDGDVIWSDPQLDTQSALITSGNNITTVVTKHLKKTVQNALTTVRNEAIHTVEWASGYTQHTRVSASTQVYIPSSSGSGSSIHKTIYDGASGFSPYKTEYHYKNGGQEKIIADEEVILPYEITYAENTNSNTPSWNTVTEKYTAAKRDYVLTDGIKGDAVISSVNGTASSNYQWGHSTEKALNDSDYYFDNLRIELVEYNSVCMGDVWTTPEQHNTFLDYEDIEIWTRTEGSDTFKPYKTLSGVNTAIVDLPDNTVGYQIKHSSEFYCTSINAKADLHLKPSNRVISFVKSDIGSGLATLIKNKALLSLTTVKNNETVTTNYDTSEADGWLTSYELNIGTSSIYTAKDCSNEESNIYSDSSTATETTPVMISGWGYNNSGNLKLMKSGVFYDLIPQEFSVDKNTVFVVPLTTNTASRNANVIDADRYNAQLNSTTNNKLSSSCYDVTFTENWQDTGRTLMTITVNIPDNIKATGLDVFYKMKTSYVNLVTNGLNQLNYVAFEDTTEEQSIPNYKNGNLSSIDKKYRSAFETVNGSLTAFAQAETHCILPLIYEYGIRSVVKTEGVYKTKNETVGLNSDYSYFISYSSSSSAYTKDLVIYDVIEQRIDGQESEWMGEFNSVDISSLKVIESANASDGTCAPVVYYSTKPKDSFTESDFDLSKTNVWTTTMPEDKSLVTAVAVDCSKTNLNKDFVLPPRKQLSININMKSPESADRNDKVTYNEAFVKGLNQELESNISEVTRESVTLHFTPPAFGKTAFPESGTLDSQNKVVNGDVVKNSTIDYKLSISNPDDTLTVYNIVVEDTLQSDLSINNPVTVSMGESDTTSIDKSARISSYSITENAGITKFTATIKSLAPGESMTITVPATVSANNGTRIDNTSYITGYNGMTFDKSKYIVSDTTHHVVADIKVKIKKVNSKEEGLAGAQLQILNSDNSVKIDNITSTTDVMTFEIEPGNYILHEVSSPSETYQKAADIPFTVDVEGIAHVNGKPVNYVEMIDQPAYKIIFHENKPEGTSEEKQKVFRIYEPDDLENSKITHFYDIPEWAGDEYVFAGWYHNKKYDYLVGITNDNTTAKLASNFETEAFTKANSGGNANTGNDYHIYAKWIKVGTVNQDESDKYVYGGSYRGFGLAGIQIREENMYDSNHSADEHTSTPAGMRYISSFSTTLYNSIDALSTTKVHTDDGYDVDVEYGYVASSETNIKAFTTQYGVKEPTDYPLQYKGENVNGKNTTGETREVDTDFRHIMNVNCTRYTGKIKDDHRNFEEYRLFTFIITYEGNDKHSRAEAQAMKNDKVCARAYIRYYDANGKLRVFYNTYKKSMYSGCLCSYNQAYSMMGG